MARVKRGIQAKKRRKSLLARNKGYLHGRKSLVRVARQASLRAMHNAYRDRRNKKRTFRSLWIIRLNAALRAHDLTYSRFIPMLQKAKIDLNRKVLSELAVDHPELFEEIVNKAKAAK